MKTDSMRINWMLPVVGIVLTAYALMAAAPYLGIKRFNHAGRDLGGTLDRLYQDQKLSAALKEIHKGDVDTAAQRLDMMLCSDIVRVNSQLGSASDAEKVFVRGVFAKIARVRPKNSETPAGAAPALTRDQLEAERILQEADLE
jgi:hypothetical protein